VVDKNLIIATIEVAKMHVQRINQIYSFFAFYDEENRRERVPSLLRVFGLILLLFHREETRACRQGYDRVCLDRRNYYPPTSGANFQGTHRYMFSDIKRSKNSTPWESPSASPSDPVPGLSPLAFRGLRAPTGSGDDPSVGILAQSLGARTDTTRMLSKGVRVSAITS
jgi:hypothetical protein